MATDKTSHRGLKICIAVSVVFFLILTTVIVTLIFTIFKPKDPEINVHPVGLENVQYSFSPNLTMNVTLGMVITIENPNYGSFRNRNSTGYVNYRDAIFAEVPMETVTIPARRKINVTTSADFMLGNVIYDPRFWSDVGAGTLNLTTNATLPGKVTILKIFKLKATFYNSCDISVNVTSKGIDTKCISKIKV